MLLLSFFFSSLHYFVSEDGPIFLESFQKLQWAVYEALRAHNVGPTHENFKMFASILARAVRRLIYHMNSAVSGPLVGSTSERMLRFARRHVLAVIKGASVEEIIAEYSKMQQKQRKPQG